jgi:hypothetical protein
VRYSMGEVRIRLPHAELPYTNSYQESSKKAPFERVFCRRCRSTLFWSETEKQKVFGPDILQQAKRQVHTARECLRIV